MIKFYCDRCNDEVGSKDKFYAFSLVSTDRDQGGYDHEVKAISKINEVCLDCVRNIVCFVSNPFAYSNHVTTGVKGVKGQE